MYPLFASYFWLIYLSASVLTAEGKVLLLNWTYCDWSVFVCETEVRNLSTSQRSYYSSLQCNFWWTDWVTADELVTTAGEQVTTAGKLVTTAGELVTTAGELVTTAGEQFLFSLKIEAEQRSTKQARGFKLLWFLSLFFSFFATRRTGLDHRRENSRGRRAWVQSLSCKEFKKSWLMIYYHKCGPTLTPHELFLPV